MGQVSGTDTLFESGEQIRWNPGVSYPGGFFPPPDWMKEIYGEGPFLVEAVETVSTDRCCQCGGSMPSDWWECPMHLVFPNATTPECRSVREAVGHPQRVTVSTEKGSAVFSGAYFFTRHIGKLQV